MRAFMADVAVGAFTYAPAATAHLVRAMRVDEEYADLRLGLVDATVVALAEQLGVRRIATRDVRHFGAIRFTDGSAFDLVVTPTGPDRS